MSPPARRSKRLSLQNLLRPIRVAELEGSSALPAQPRNGSPSSDDRLETRSSRMSQRFSLNRMLHSRRLAELEANTDALPMLSHIDLNQFGEISRPQLPAKDIGVKAVQPVLQSTSQTMNPVELDASGPERLSSPSLNVRSPYKSRADTIATFVGSSSASATSSRSHRALGRDDKGLDNMSGEVSINYMKAPAESAARIAIPRTPDAVEILDLTSAEGEGDPSGSLEWEWRDSINSPSDCTASVSSPLGKAPLYPSLTADIVSAAKEPFGISPITARSNRTEKIDRQREVPKGALKVYEKDDVGPGAKRPSKQHNLHAVVNPNESQPKRPDFITFKKQITEAEKRAKMIAKRRSRRRAPKSF